MMASRPNSQFSILNSQLDKASRLLAAFVLMPCMIVLGGCGKNAVCDIPIGDATCQLNPNSPLYPGINNCDGYQYLTGGFNGLVVIRTSWNDFVCYECTCPYDKGVLEIPVDTVWDAAHTHFRLQTSYGNLVLRCRKCGSQFSTFAGGAPMEGSQTACFLYQYSTYYDGSTLYISNY